METVIKHVAISVLMGWEAAQWYYEIVLINPEKEI